MQETLDVYQRTGEPCARCGRPIKRIVIGARSTHFCSWCQRLPAADRKGSAAILRGIAGGPVRSGRRWTELAAGEGSTRLTPGQATDARDAATRDVLRAKTERTKRAAANRRAKARASMGEGAG